MQFSRLRAYLRSFETRLSNYAPAVRELDGTLSCWPDERNGNETALKIATISWKSLVTWPELIGMAHSTPYSTVAERVGGAIRLRADWRELSESRARYYATVREDWRRGLTVGFAFQALLRVIRI